MLTVNGARRSVLRATALGALGILGPTGCGFRLRGQAQLPLVLAVTLIEEDRPEGRPPSDLASQLARLLRSQGVRITEAPGDATAVLEIIDQDLSRRLIAAGEDGDVREALLRFEVEYTVRDAQGQVLLPPTDYALTRDALYDEAAVLGAAEGEQIALRQMIEDTALAIVRRLETLGGG
ncbi:MAG: LPS assembly lipoprotein LptE [Candidatus Competibacterales bacterium]